MRRNGIRTWLSYLSLVGIVCGFSLFFHTPAIAGASDLELHVVVVTPQPDSQTKNEQVIITATFSEPMVALGRLPLEKGTGLFKIEPTITGKYRWLGTTTLQLTPEKKLPPATRFTITVPEGTEALSGRKLSNPYSWTFETRRPDIVSSIPSDTAKWVNLDTNVLLFFNQSMDPVKAKNAVRFLQIPVTGKNDDWVNSILHGGKKLPRADEIPFNLSHLSKQELEDVKNPYHTTFASHTKKWGRESILSLAPVKTLKNDQLYIVCLDEGLKASTGHLGFQKAKVIGFQTVRTFEYIGVKHISTYPDDALILKFSNPVNYSEIINGIAISPKLDIPEYYSRQDWGSDILYLNLRLKPRTQYTLTISSHLKDNFGNQLGRETVVSVATHSYRPDFSMNTGINVYESYIEDPIAMTLLNIEEVRQKIALLSVDEIVPYLILMENAYDEDFDKTLENLLKNRKHGYDLDQSWKPSVAENVRATRPVDLKTFMENLNGVLFLDFHPLSKGVEHPHFRSLAQITEMAVTAKFSSENTVVFVSTLKDGKVVGNAEIQIRDSRNTILWTGLTGEDGICRAPGWGKLGLRQPRGTYKRLKQYIIVRKNQDVAFVGSDFGEYYSNVSYAVQRPGFRRFGGYVFSEKGLYKAGEKVFIKGIIREMREGEWSIPTLDEVEISVYDSRGETILEERGNLGEYGSFAREIKLPDKAVTGTYRIFVNEPVESVPEKEKKNEWERSRYYELDVKGSFQVQAYRPARFETLVAPDRDYYVMGDPVAARFTGKYLTGSPMNEEKISYAVLMRSSSFQPKGKQYAKYSFGPGYWEGDQYRFHGIKRLHSGHGLLDMNGSFTMQTQLKAAGIHDAAKVIIEGTVTGPDRQSVTNTAARTVHPALFYLGLKSDDYLVEKKQTDFHETHINGFRQYVKSG